MEGTVSLEERHKKPPSPAHSPVLGYQTCVLREWTKTWVTARLQLVLRALLLRLRIKRRWSRVLRLKSTF